MTKNLNLPFDLDRASAIAEQYGTPLYVYDEEGIRGQAQKLNQAFGWAGSYKNYFAVKALPNPTILKILHEEGMGFDCSSRTELLLVQHLGITGKDIFFTSNNTPAEDFELAIDMDTTVNLDDLAHLPNFLGALNGKRISRVAARYNPGRLKTGNDIIGEPTEAKYGMSLDQLVEMFRQLRGQEIGEYGLHTMVASNELNPDYFVETAEVLLDALERIESEVGIKFSFVNLGGGLGVNYKPDQDEINITELAGRIQEVFEKRGRADLRLCTENGRYVTGPHGFLLTKVRYVMQKYKTYLGVDASMHNLMRPGMYGAYHHITVLGRQGDEQTYDVVGALCENNDKFAIDRQLPEVSKDDLLVIHDAGAHGHAMGFNYNGLLRSAEVLLQKGGEVRLIRRAETPDDYFATAIWPQ